MHRPVPWTESYRLHHMFLGISIYAFMVIDNLVTGSSEEKIPELETPVQDSGRDRNGSVRCYMCNGLIHTYVRTGKSILCRRSVCEDVLHMDLLDANTPEAARTTAAVEITRLLDGRLHVIEAKPGLRFSANHPTPRVTSGSEKCDVHPLIDLLAFCGQLLLQPAQRPLTSSALRKEFTWVLNPVTLTALAIIDIHESPPEHLPWPRWSSPIRSAGGAAKISFLALAKEERPTDIRGGTRA